MRQETWVVTLLDGTVEHVYGQLKIEDGVLWINERSSYSPRYENQAAYPLTSVKKWERE